MTSVSHTPKSLATSKYAPGTSRLPVQKEPLPETMSHALVTTDQSSFSHQVEPKMYENGGTQLALAQGEKLNSMIAKHNTNFEKSLSTSVANMRALIESLHHSIKKSRPDTKDMETTNILREELDSLYLLATGIKEALPKFLDQQKQNYALYHQTALHAGIRQSYAEINMQKEKIELQDSLILNQQRSFLQFQADTKAQLDQLAELQERVSRLILDRGLLKNELNKLKEDQERMKTSTSDEKGTYEDLQTHIKNLVATKKDLEVENQTLRNTMCESQLNVLNSEKRSSEVQDKVTAETTTIHEKLQREIKLRQAAEALSVELKLQDKTNKAEITRLTNLSKMQLKKYNEQSAEFGILTHNLNSNKTTVDELKGQLEQANAESARLKTEQDALRKTKDQLESQLKKLQTEYDDLNTKSKGLPEETSKMIELQIEKKSLQSMLEKLQRENEELEIEINELVAEKASFKDNQTSNSISGEGQRKINELQATIDKLGTSNKDLETKLQDLEAKKAKLDEEFEQWQALAKVTD